MNADKCTGNWHVDIYVGVPAPRRQPAPKWHLGHQEPKPIARQSMPRNVQTDAASARFLPGYVSASIRGVPIASGPRRHPPSDRMFLCYLDPDGITVEYGFGMEELPAEDT